MSKTAYKIGDKVKFSGMIGVIKRIEIRTAGFPDYFIQFSDGNGATWAQENELDTDEEAATEAKDVSNDGC